MARVKDKPVFCFVMPWHISEGRGGGAEIQSWLLASELAKISFTVHYICQTIDKNKIGTSSFINDVNIHWLPKSSKLHWSDSRKYYKKLVNIKPDFVVQRLASADTYYLGLYCKRYKANFVWISTDSHSSTRWIFLKRRIYLLRDKKITFLKFLVFSANAIIEDIMRHAGMKMIRFAFTQNREQWLQLKQNFGIDSGRILSGHPLPQTKIDYSERYKQKVVIWAGNLGRNKRPELFIQLARDCSIPDLRFVLIGGHSDTTYLKTILHNIPRNLTVTGKLSFEDTLKWFDRASILVNTSLKEGFPNTFIQSWLRGIPVITTGVNPDLIITENNLGIIADSSANLLNALHELLSDEEKYSKQGTHIMEFALKRFSIEVTAAHFLNQIGLTTVEVFL